MRNRQVGIDFKASGIKDIIRELEKLQEQAKQVKLAEGLETQFATLADQANSLKEALTDLQKVFGTEPKEVKNDEISSMEKKIEEVKKAVSTLTHSLATENAKIDATMERIDTAVSKMNDEKTFNGILEQIGKVEEGFNSLIELANTYRQTLSAPIDVAPKGLQKVDKAKIKQLENLLGKQTSVTEDIRKMSDEEMESMLSKMSMRIDELHALQEKDGADKLAINRELLEILTRYKDMADDDDDNFAERLTDIADEKFRNLGDALYETNKKTGETEYKAIFKQLEATLKEELSNLQAGAGDTKQFISVLDGIKATLYRKGKKTTVEMDLDVAEGQEAKLTAQIENIVDKLNKKKRKPIEVPIKSNIEKLQEGSKEAIANIKKELESQPANVNVKISPEQVQKELNAMGTLTLPIGNIAIKKDVIDKAHIEQEVEDVKKKMSEVAPSWAKVRTDLLDMSRSGNLTAETFQQYEHFNDVMEAIGGTTNASIKSVEKMVDAINQLTASEDPAKLKKFTTGLGTVGEKFDEIQKAKREAAKVVEVPGDILSQHIVAFIKELNKIPKIMEEMRFNLNVGNTEVNVEGLHDVVQGALDKLEDLHISINRIDMNQATIDKLKIDVKQDTLKLIDVEERMIAEMRLLANELLGPTHVLNQGGEMQAVLPQTGLQKAFRALDELGKFINLMVTQYDLLGRLSANTDKQTTATEVPLDKFSENISIATVALDEMANAVKKCNDQLSGKVEEPQPQEKTTKEKFQEYVNNRRKTTQEKVEQHTPEEPINIIKNDVSEIARDVKQIAKESNPLASGSELSKNISDMIKSGIIAGNTQVTKDSDMDRPIEAIEKNALLRVAKHMDKDATYDRERAMFANSKTGQATPIGVTGLAGSLSADLLNNIVDYYKGNDFNVMGHWHPSRFAVPSRGDLSSFYSAMGEGVSKQFIASQNQISVINMNLIKRHRQFYKDVMTYYEQMSIDEKALEKEFPDMDSFDRFQVGMRRNLEQAWKEVGEVYTAEGKKVPKFGNWMKTLDFDDIRNVPLSDIDKLFGMKSGKSTGTVEQLLANINRNVGIIANGVTQGVTIGGKEDSSTNAMKGDYQVGTGKQAKEPRDKYTALLNEFKNSKYKTLKNFAKSKGLNDEAYQKLENKALQKGVVKVADTQGYKDYKKSIEQQEKLAEQQYKNDLAAYKGTVEAKEELANRQYQKEADNYKKNIEQQERLAQQQWKNDNRRFQKEMEAKEELAKQQYQNLEAEKREREDIEYYAEGDRRHAEEQNYVQAHNAFKAEGEAQAQAIIKENENYINWWNKALDERDLREQKERESYVQWWEKSLNEKEAAERNALARQQKLEEERKQQERDSYVQWWEKSLNERDVSDRQTAAKAKQKEIDDRKKAEESYVAWWEDTLNKQEVAERKAAQRADEDRFERINRMATSTTKVLENTDLLAGSRASAEAFLQDLQEIQTMGKVDADTFDAIEAEFKQINAEIQTSIAAQREMNVLAKDLETIESSKVRGKDRNVYMPEYLEKVARAKAIIQSRQANGEYLTNDELTYINAIRSESRNPSGAILTGDKSVLQRNITKAEKMLATNYMPGDLQNQLKDVVAQMRNLEGQTDVSKESIDRLTESFRKVEMEAARAGKTFLGQVGQRLKDMNAKFIATYFSFMDIIRYMRSMISTITELDTALTEMRKVSDESLKTLKEYQKTTFDTAGALGTTAVQLQQSTADWLRLGESLDEASKSAKAATTLFNVSEFENINQATEALVSMSQAYKDLDKTEIIDVLNNIGNNYSIATDQLATALQASSAALVTQGNDLYEAAALVTAGNAIIQDANKVGTGIRTISLRIAGVKEGDDDIRQELEELGEEVDDWVVSTEAKKRKVIMDYTRVASNNGQGVDILDSNGNLKNTYTILLEISKIYKEIQEEDKKYGTNRAKGLVEELAGKVRSNIAASILMNPELLENVYNSAIDSAGSAAEENAKYLDSIVGKTQQFKNELQELEQNALDSELIKDTIDLGTALLSIFNGLGDALPKVIALLGSAALGVANFNKETVKFITYTGDAQTGGLAGKGLFRGLAKFAGVGAGNPWMGIDFNEALSADMSRIYANSTFQEKVLSQYAGAIPTKAIDEFVEKHGDLDGAINQSSKVLLTKGITSEKEYGMAVENASAQVQRAEGQVKAFNAVMASISAIAVIAAISIAVAGIRKLIKYTSELEQKAIEASDKIKEITDELKDNDKYIKDVTDEYVRLSKEVDDLGNNVSLSADEFARYNEISNEIADRMPEMVSGWTSEGNAIIDVKDSVEGLTEAYRAYRRARLEEAADPKNIQANADVLNNYLNPKWHQRAINGVKMVLQKGGLRQAVSSPGLLGYYDVESGTNTIWDQILNTSYDDFTMKMRDYPLRGYLVDFLLAKSYSDVLAYMMRGNMELLKGNKQFQGISQYTTVDMSEGYKTEISESAYSQLQKEAIMIQDNNKRKLQEYLNNYTESVVATLDFNIEIGDVELSDNQHTIAQSVIGNVSDEFKQEMASDEVMMNAFTNEVIKWTEGVDEDLLSKLYGDKSKDTNYRETYRELADAYNTLVGQVWGQLGEDATDEEIQHAQEFLQAVKKASGLEDYANLDEEFNQVTREILENGTIDAKKQELRDKIKDYSANNMQLVLDAIDSSMNPTEAIEAIDKAFATAQQNAKVRGLGELLSSNGMAGYSTTWKEVKDELVGLAQAGKLDETTLKEYDFYNKMIEELGLSAEEADEALSDMIDTINSMSQQNAVDVLNSYKNGVDNLADAYEKFQNGEFIDAATLSGIQDTFGYLGDSYQEFEDAVMRGEKDLQPYFDNIVTEYAIQESALAELTEENKDWVKQQLIASGITEASADKAIKQSLERKNSLENEIRATLELMNAEVQEKQGRDDLVVSTENLDKLTAEEIVLLMQEANMSGEAAQAVALFALKKELAKDAALRNEDDINYLLQLISLADLGGKKVTELKYKLENQQKYQEKAADLEVRLNNFYAKHGRNTSTYTDPGVYQEWKALEGEAEYLNNWLGNIDTLSDDVLQEIYGEHPELDYTLDLDLDYGGAVDSAKEAGSAAGEAFKEALDKILAMYDAELDAGVISFQTYVDKSRAIIEQYYRDGKIKAQDYYDELASLYEKQVQQYDKVISAVQKRLQDETDALEKQKETIENSYNGQIEVIQKKIDALQDENDEIDRNLELSKAQYELARAQNQRTKLMYSESRGFYYAADLQGISDAEDNVRKARTNKQVAEYEKQIKSLQDAMESETKSIDDQIKKLNEYSEAWGKVSSKLEEAQNNLRATEILGPDWEANILSGLSLLEDFTNQYVLAQQKQKQAYLDARTAEANNPVNAEGGGTVNSGGTGSSGGGGGNGGNGGGGGGNTPTGHSQGNTNNGNIPLGTLAEKRQEQQQDENKYEFNGVKYKTKSSADQARMDYIDNAGTAAYNQAMSYSIPDQNTKVRNAEKARKEAEAEARKKQVKALFSGTDSAKPGKTLVGEIAPEIVVHNNGTASIVDSPTLMDMKGGEKVFNGDETEKILKSKYVPMKQYNPKKFAMLHAFAGGTSSPLQNAIAAQAVGIASGIKSGLIATTPMGGQTINQTFNITMPNITNASKADELFREFEQLSRRATQYYN